PQTNPTTLVIGVASLLFLVLARRLMTPLLARLGVTPTTAALLSRLAPMLAVIVATAAVAGFGLDRRAGVSIVGEVPSGLPSLFLSAPSLPAIQQLWLPALLIALVGFVESVSVAQSLALKRQQ